MSVRVERSSIWTSVFAEVSHDPFRTQPFGEIFDTTKKTNFTVNFFTLYMFYTDSRRNIKTLATLFWPRQENQNETVTGIAYEMCINFLVVLVSDDKYPGEV